MEKPGNWFAKAKICEKHLKEKQILSKFLKMSLFDWSFQFQLMPINKSVFQYEEYQLQMDNITVIFLR